MAKATGLIFSLFDVASSREVPFGTDQALVIAYILELEEVPKV